ncbi:MAG: zinc dependent phospholipase C family protein [Acidobacteriaceae bacterium]|nr:zinc dependent phospholipase C family protein [Acidobacteriaceae bacterium]
MPLVFTRRARALLAVCCALLVVRPALSYSVLTHEAVVDALWEVKLKPVLLARFPNATPEELKTAHGYAYGGAIVQDMGYYPHGSMQFSDLTHYVRTGDFIVALLTEAQTLNELAFALGALAHYVGDCDGHRYATNVGEPILYPRVQRKYGDYVTYEQDPARHLDTEFGFDVLEVAKGNFAPQAYHDFIGFFVAKDVLQRAFRDTYGLDLNDVFKDFDLAAGSYRRAVSKTIPHATRVAWAQKKHEIQQSEPGMTRRRFVYVMSRSSYERNWGKQYERLSAWDRTLAFLLRLVPPIGPLKALHFKMPTPPVEKLFMASFDRTAKQFDGSLDDVRHSRLQLENKNYDVGVVTQAGEYRLEDNIQAYWLDKLAEKNFSTATPQIRSELLSYFGNPNAPIELKNDRKKWQRLETQLAELRAAPPNVVAAGAQAR